MEIDVHQEETDRVGETVFEGSRSFVVVAITDSGVGIPEENLPRIFEPFYTTKPAGEGTGLGLDICRRIVERHSGQITVQSVPGNTTVTVWLPTSYSQ
ncbi:MAG: HAMP domain-containing sensor histidine kinase [bacterium]|nr:HAMP domain-containing sensor histidine kinase [bacterium]